MRIGIDFDNTIVKTREKVKEYLDKYGIEELTEETKYDFYKEHIDEMTKSLELEDNVLEVLNSLSSDNELYIITARGDYYSKNLKDLTIKYVKDKKLPIKEICFDCYKETKGMKCVQLKIDLFIDDDILNCMAVKEQNIDVILYKNKIEGIKSIDNWQEIKDVIYGRKSNY